MPMIIWFKMVENSNEIINLSFCEIIRFVQENSGTHLQTTSTGFKQAITNYQAQNCSTCPLNGTCHKSKGNRIIGINHNINKLKQQAKENLQSDEVIAHRKKRCWDVEPVFGNIKNNHHFKRFILRGIKKVTVEVGLLSLSQNLRKKAAIKSKIAAFKLQKLRFLNIKPHSCYCNK